MLSSLPRLAERVRFQLWLVPMVMALLSGVGAVAVVLVDGGTGLLDSTLRLDPDSARAALGAIATAMISFTALVFSVTMLLLQLASAQLSPRVTRVFLRDRFNQVVLGLFVATFVFALIVLVAVGEDSVPALSVVIAIALVLLAVLVFVVYIDHVANAIKASSFIRATGGETADVIVRVYEEADRSGQRAPSDTRRDGEVAAGDGGRVVRSPHASGYVVTVDEDAILAAAVEAGTDVDLLVGPGDHVVEGAPLLAVTTDTDRADAISDAVAIGDERSMSQDPRYGFRLLVDIALKALSPGINDPTTAVEAVHELHRLLRLLLDRRVEAPRILRHDGRAVVTIAGPGFDTFVDAAVTEIAAAGRAQAPVVAALRDMLDELAADASDDRRGALLRAGAALPDIERAT